MGELSPTEQRAALLARLSTQTWDLVVIGGGISGAGVANASACCAKRRAWWSRKAFCLPTAPAASPAAG